MFSMNRTALIDAEGCCIFNLKCLEKSRALSADRKMLATLQAQKKKKPKKKSATLSLTTTGNKSSA